jgi:hypothetical protein
MAVLLPHGTFLREDRLNLTSGSAELFGVSLPEAVDSYSIELNCTSIKAHRRDTRDGLSGFLCSKLPSDADAPVGRFANSQGPRDGRR